MINMSTMRPRLISFSLYGQDALYLDGAIENVRLAARFYPGWQCRFYVDDSVPCACVEALRRLGAEIVPVQVQKGPHYGHYWRFLPAADRSLDRVIFRDADSRLNVRESAAVAEWIASGASLHFMRDNAAHHRKAALGGMWGCTGAAIPDIDELIHTRASFSQQSQCDNFVSTVIYPRFEGDRCVHDDHAFSTDSRPFPGHAPLEGTSFVGEIVPPKGSEPAGWNDPWLRAGQEEAQRWLAQRQAAEAAYERDRVAAELANALARLEQVSMELKQLRASKSWALTAPCRVMGSFARKLRSRILNQG
jgi:hypothetical protein